MRENLDLLISIMVTATTVIATFVGGIFTYHKFMIKKIEDTRKEMYKEIAKLKDDSDKRDEEIKEALKEFKNDLIRRDEDLKNSIKEMKDDLKQYFSFIKEKSL